MVIISSHTTTQNSLSCNYTSLSQLTARALNAEWAEWWLHVWADCWPGGMATRAI